MKSANFLRKRLTGVRVNWADADLDQLYTYDEVPNTTVVSPRERTIRFYLHHWTGCETRTRL